MLEEWKVVPSLPEYEASSLGRVRRIPFEAPMPHGGTRVYGGVPGIGQWCADQSRYILVFRRKSYKVARLVCEAFHGPAPFPRAVVMHLNEDSRVNSPNNLAWGTQRQNQNAPGLIAYRRSRTGENSNLAAARRKRGVAA